MGILGVYIILSFISSLVLAGAIWAPLCCVACVVEAHVHLAGQLRATLNDPHFTRGWNLPLLASANATHGRLVQRTSRRLKWFSGFHLLACGYVAWGCLLETALSGVKPAPLCVCVAALLAVLHLLHTLGDGNARRSAHLNGAVSELLRSRLEPRETSASEGPDQRRGPAHEALGALTLVRGEIGLAPSLSVLGIAISPHAAPVGVLVSVALLAASIQIGSFVE